MKIVLKSVATTAAAALAIGGFSLAVIQPATATGTPASGTPATSPHEVAAYIYQMDVPTDKASWENSGKQTLLTVVPGTEWITDISAHLPKAGLEICGPGWAIQQDKLAMDIPLTFVWPVNIEYPEGFPAGATLTTSKHEKLEVYGTVPDCDPTPETPTPTPETPTPTPTPETPDTPKPTPTPTPETPDTPKPTPPVPPVTTPPVTTVPPVTTPPTAVPPVTTVPPAATPEPETPELAVTGANAPAMAVLAAAGALAAGLGTLALVRNRRRTGSSDA